MSDTIYFPYKSNTHQSFLKNGFGKYTQSINESVYE